MNQINNINALLDQGDYLKAASSVDELTNTNCRSLCQKLSEVNNIGDSIDHITSIVTSLEDSIGRYRMELRSVEDTVYQMASQEHAVQVQFNNTKLLCDTITDMVENLHLSDDVRRTLLEGDLDDVASIEKALDKLKTILNYKGDPGMKCLRDQQEYAEALRRRFCDRLENQQALFSNLMEQQLKEIRDFRPPKTSKCGVLSVLKNFEQFAKTTGEVARKSDIERWYVELVTELFNVIDSTEHSKTPPEMIRLENYNYLDGLLRSIKVPCLKAQQEEANSRFKAALNAYVTRYFGRPLEKINTFFEGVQTKVAQGVKEEEISFQLAFSKQELRKVLQSVTLKEVRKGLEEMYRRIEKHASEPDSNLIQVIWHAMQTEFLSQYKSIQSMIERCYPSSNLGLTFTIDDILQVFIDIAQTH